MNQQDKLHQQSFGELPYGMIAFIRAYPCSSVADNF
jgi:hypothetical protein